MRSIRKLALALLVIVAGCSGASQRSDGTAAAAQLTELQSLASDAGDLRACSKLGSVAEDFKKGGVSRERTSLAFFSYYDCMGGSASLRKHRSDEIGAAAQNDAVKVASARVSAAALREATDYWRRLQALHVPITL